MGLLVPAGQIVDNPLKGLLQSAPAVAAIVLQFQFFSLGAVEQGIHSLGRELLQGCIQGKTEFPAQGLVVHPADGVVFRVAPAAGDNTALQDGQAFVGHDEVRIYLQLIAQTAAVGAGTIGIVEGEHAGL